MEYAARILKLSFGGKSSNTPKVIVVKADHFSSHWHWDHIGDPSTFPPTTDLIVGAGFKEAMLPGAPANPESPILESDYA